MRFQFEDNDIEAIAMKVVEVLKPLFASISKPEPDEIFTKKELAEYLKVSVSTINSLLSEGSLPFFKIAKGQSGGVRFKKSDIDKWITRQTIPPVNPVKTLRLAKA